MANKDLNKNRGEAEVCINQKSKVETIVMFKSSDKDRHTKAACVVLLWLPSQTS